MEFPDFRAKLSLLWQDFSELAMPLLRERIEAARKRLESERLKILVVGEFSRGKSTFINALIGEPVLPSKVNPTTATINILSKGKSRLCTIEYQDGREVNLDLPDSRVNRFLDEFVTTANNEARNIRLVKLFLPGRLERIEADIVDTPGVNDLDQMREEITFRYLREADAVVLLLDAHQPLSQSERIFLKEKVLGNDINRIVYVINKIDEVLLSGTDEDIPKIVDYVKQRLEQLLGITNPMIYALSAKNALRARFKNEPDPSPTSFLDFESELVHFAGEQATSGRLHTHLERFAKIFTDQQLILGQQMQALQTEISEIEGHLQKVSQQRQVVVVQLQQLEDRMKSIQEAMAESIKNYSHQQLQKMRNSLDTELSNCANEEHLEEFRSSLSRHLRDLQLSIEKSAYEEKKRWEKRLGEKFKDLLAPESSVTAIRTVSQITLSVSNAELGQAAYIPIEEISIGGGDLVSGTIAGLITSFLLGPFVGVGAAIVTVLASVTGRQEQRNAEILRQAREEMKVKLEQNFSFLAQRVSEMGEKIAKNHSESLVQHYRERAESHLSSFDAVANAAKETQGYSKLEKERALEELNRQIESLYKVKQRWESIKNECFPPD